MVDNEKLNCKCKTKVEEETKAIEQESFAMTLVKEYAKTAHKFFVLSLVILVMWLSTIGVFIWYLNQYDFSSETITVEQDGEGYNNYVGEDGVINNGAENNSNDQEKN